MTRNSKLYAGFCVIWSVGFFSVLHWALFDQEGRWPYIVASALTYGMGFAIMGALLGRFDKASSTRHDLQLLYSSTSNIISFFIGGLWILLFRGEHWWELPIAGGFLAVALGLTLRASRRRIKGMSKQELFK